MLQLSVSDLAELYALQLSVSDLAELYALQIYLIFLNFQRKLSKSLYKSSSLIFGFRCIVTGIVMLGAVTSLDTVWGFAHITMAMMTICNLAAIVCLGKYAIICLRDYQS